MAAALTRQPDARQAAGALQPTLIARDLSAIADLVEQCFEDVLDQSGRAAIREMKALGNLGPLLTPLSLLDQIGWGLAMGFVWREDGRLVGNVSLYRGGRHPRLGPGWLIANVAVHPDVRRRGIALALMNAALERIEALGGRWTALQVDSHNDAAYRLYDGMGFETFETLSQWETSGLFPRALPEPDPRWQIRPRRSMEVRREAGFIFDRARRGGMAWTRPIEASDLRGSTGFWQIETPTKEYWVQTHRQDPGLWLGTLWLEQGWRRSQASLFLDPLMEDPAGRQALLLQLLSRPALQHRPLRIETQAGDSAVEDLLGEMGFQRTRSLIQMRLEL